MMIGMVVAAMSMVQLSFALDEQTKKTLKHRVVMETSEGAITIELWADKAPETVKNFLRYADEKFYDGTIFHRVIDNFMIQGGGFGAGMSRKDSHKPIKNEASSELKNYRGTIAMARTSDIHSATCQFFINLRDNNFLNHSDNTEQGFGYAVFGKVIKGMEVVDRIGKTKTTSFGPYSDVPAKPVIIKSVKRLESN
jgi:peptidyl-prolyl cis-trans isomerase B (cyclophilin B)